MAKRYLDEVIDQMIAFIPDEEVNFIASLQNIQESCRYTAPEAMMDRWVEAACLLKDEMGEPHFENGDWRQKVYRVWMDMDVGD